MSMYTPAQLERAIERQKALPRELRRRRDGQLCRVTALIDPVLFHNTRECNKDVYGVDNIWDEPEWVNDQLRRHPELRVESERRGPRIGAGPGRAAPGRVGRLTRFGRVTWSRTYR